MSNIHVLDTYIYLRAYLHTYMYTYVYTYMCICVCIYSMYVFMYIYVYTNVYSLQIVHSVYTYIHIPPSPSLPSSIHPFRTRPRFVSLALSFSRQIRLSHTLIGGTMGGVATCCEECKRNMYYTMRETSVTLVSVRERCISR